MSRCKYRTNSEDLKEILRADVFENLGSEIANCIITDAANFVDSRQDEWDGFRNHRNVSYNSIMRVYVQDIFWELGIALVGDDDIHLDYD